jgi:hypothetical protein
VRSVARWLKPEFATKIHNLSGSQTVTQSASKSN